jgi:glycosyltransferase involved in cell wall biosynthesis
VTRLTAGKLGPLFEWTEGLFRSPGRELHLIGPQQDKTIHIPDWVKYQGPASPEQLRMESFPRATRLLSLSTHPEGRPQVMLEAMAAGLPILASSNPAHVDLVTHRGTGWICNESTDFEAGLSFIEDSGNNSDMGDLAREQARLRFGDWDDCASRYANLYEELLG